MNLTIGLCDPVTEPAAGLHPLPGVTIGRVVRFSDNVLWRAPVEGDGKPVHSTASDYVCLVATSPEGVSEARRLSAEVLAATGIEIPVADLGDLSKINRRKAVSEFCVRALASRAVQAERRVGQMAEALATLRREHEMVLQRFAELEANVVMQGQQPVRIVCGQTAVDAFAELGETTRLGRHARLDLPFSTIGLYLLSLYVDAEDAEGPLDISIETRGAPRILARWTQELRHDKADWLTWTRKLSITDAYSGARLHIAFRGKGTVRIGMGPHHPAKRIWLAGANGQSEPRHIAMRALATTPGLRTPEPSGTGTDVKRIWDLERATQVAPSPDDIPDLVSPALEGGVVVTPMIGQITAARIGAALPAGASAVRATAIVAHADGPLVDFALISGDADAVREMVLNEQVEQSETFSGWTTGAALSPVTLTLALHRAATEQDTLFLLTRISPESTHDWCARAVFRSVQILVDREARDAG